MTDETLVEDTEFGGALVRYPKMGGIGAPVPPD